MIAPVVVTGASGFVGSALVKWLLARDREVWAVSRSEIDLPGARHYRVRDYGTTPVPPHGILVHLAESPHLGEAEEIGEKYISDSTERLDQLLSKPWDRVVYASSGIAAGVYGRAKQACESKVRAGGGAVVRLTSIYGPGMAPSSVVQQILQQIPGVGPLLVRNAESERDFLWYDDAAGGLAHIATGRAVGTFDLATGRAVSIGDLARLALDIAGALERQVSSTGMPKRTRALGLDPAATHKAFGWRAETSLRDGLAQMIGCTA